MPLRILSHFDAQEPVAYWTLDKTLGEIKGDNSLTFVTSAAANLMPSMGLYPLGGYLNLASEDYPMLSNFSPMVSDGSGDFSVDFWLRSSNVGAWNTFLSYSTSIYDNEFMVMCDTTGTLKVYFHQQSHTLGSICWSILDGKWHHVAFVYQKSLTTFNFYVDAVVRGTKTGSISHTLLNNGCLILGGEQDCLCGCLEAYQRHIGGLAKVKFWNFALSQEQVYYSQSSSGLSNMTAYRGSLGRILHFIYTGPRDGANVIGTDVYADDSDVATAAVHAGASFEFCRVLVGPEHE